MTRMVVPCPGCNRVVPGITPGWFCTPPRKRVLVSEAWVIKRAGRWLSLASPTGWWGWTLRCDRTRWLSRDAAEDIARHHGGKLVRVRTFEVKR